MNRLTKRAKDGLAYSDIPLNQSSVLDVNENIVECYTGFIAERLAAYEDTGLEPEEVYKTIKAGVPEWIPKYLEYRKLEEQGLLIKLPCKVGDFVFEANINRNIISSYIITAIVVGKNSRNYKWGLLDGIYSNMNGFNEFALDKSVFLTREEAEKALKEMEGKQ